MRRPLLPTVTAAEGLEKICCCDLDQSFSTKPDQNFGGFEIFYDLLSPSLALSPSLSVYTSLALSLSVSLSCSLSFFSLSLSCSLSHPQKHFIPFLILPLYLYLKTLSLKSLFSPSRTSTLYLSHSLFCFYLFAFSLSLRLFFYYFPSLLYFVYHQH